jgi:hypothetical protein
VEHWSLACRRKLDAVDCHCPACNPGSSTNSYLPSQIRAIQSPSVRPNMADNSLHQDARRRRRDGACRGRLGVRNDGSLTRRPSSRINSAPMSPRHWCVEPSRGAGHSTKGSRGLPRTMEGMSTTRYFSSPTETPAESASGTLALDAKSAHAGHGEGAPEFHRRVGDDREGNTVFSFAPLVFTIYRLIWIAIIDRL